MPDTNLGYTPTGRIAVLRRSYSSVPQPWRAILSVSSGDHEYINNLNALRVVPGFYNAEEAPDRLGAGIKAIEKASSPSPLPASGQEGIPSGT